jgi:hypothetical protein
MQPPRHHLARSATLAQSGQSPVCRRSGGILAMVSGRSPPRRLLGSSIARLERASGRSAQAAVNITTSPTSRPSGPRRWESLWLYDFPCNRPPDRAYNAGRRISAFLRHIKALPFGSTCLALRPTASAVLATRDHDLWQDEIIRVTPFSHHLAQPCNTEQFL